MEKSNQSLEHLLFTLSRFVDLESNKWTPLEPRDCQEECFSQRGDILDWLMTLNKELEFSDETLFLAVDIFDRFLQRIKAQPKYLRCIGISCLYLAAKVNEEDEDVPATGDFIETSGCGLSEAEVLRMERCILTKLDWTLTSSPTSLQFMHLFDALVRTKCPSLNNLIPDGSAYGNYIMTTALSRCAAHRQLFPYQPSTISLAIIQLYLQATWIYWLPAIKTLQAHTLISDDQLSECTNLVEGFVGSYIRNSVMISTRHVLLQQNNNNNNSVKLSCSQSEPAKLSCSQSEPVEQPQASQEEKMMGSLSVTMPSNKIPLSNPVSPDPPAKRRRVEMDEDVYSDIRSLYESPLDVEPARKAVYVPRFREVTPLVTYAAVVRSTCASEALHLVGAAHAMSIQQVAST